MYKYIKPWNKMFNVYRRAGNALMKFRFANKVYEELFWQN